MDKKFEQSRKQIPNQPPQDLIMKGLRTGLIEERSGGSKIHDPLRDKSPLIKGFDLIHHELQWWHPTD